MDLSLIAAATGINWAWWGNLAQGIGALGLVILIHEFGHFAAAKLCGVKVEKFYIGFDPYGLRLCRIRWGETEYGIGLIPLGGYVYMLGQTDNPAKQAEEAERAKAAAAAGKPIDPALAAEAAAVWDPRSYPAQSVPERMLIISAGVIMNTITAFLFAIGAYLIGVEHTPAAVSAVSPGGAAWENDLRNGDEIINVDGIEKPRFEADLRSRAVLADLNRGLPMRVKRGSEEFDLTITPRKIRPDIPPTLGIGGPQLTKLGGRREGATPVMEGSAASRSAPPLQLHDEIIKINDREIKTFADVDAALTVEADAPLDVVVRRKTTDAAGKEAVTEVKSVVPVAPWRTLGLTLELGPIAFVQKNSPAAAAKLQPGDKLLLIDGQPIGDPATLAERLRRKQAAAPQTAWKLSLLRTTPTDPKGTAVEIEVMPRAADYAETPLMAGAPLSIPTLGIALPIKPVVVEVDAIGPAAKSGLRAGDVLTQLKTIPSDEPLASGEKAKPITVPLVDADSNNWPWIATVLLQSVRPSTKIELTTEDKRTVVIEPADLPGFFESDRGFIFEPRRELRRADSFSEAVDYAWYDTRDSLTQVYRFLHALFIGQIPASNVGGVITIADQAGQSASQGFAQLLLFVMMLSCNLAVLNFLPFPVLDGGHMVFLIYEGIFRRPPPEKLFIALNTLGLFSLLGLMLFALSNDIMRLIR